MNSPIYHSKTCNVSQCLRQSNRAWGDLAVVIPCFRVAEHLPAVIAAIGPEVHLIYCVIDGCPEGSGGVAEEIARQESRVRVLYHEKNLGVGAACRTGFQRAIEGGAEIIVKLDGDGQMRAELIAELVQPILDGEADYVKGNRFFNLEDARRMLSIRFIGNAGLTFLTKMSSGYWNIFDPTNGFVAMSQTVARQLPWSKIGEDYFFESDLLFRLNTLRAVVVDYPMEARYGSEQSNLDPMLALRQFPLNHLRNLVKRLLYSYFLRDFNVASVHLLVGLSLVAFGTWFGADQWIRGIERNQFASSGTVMLAALPLILGWQALLAFVAYDVGSVPTKVLHRFRREMTATETAAQDES